ncbi:conserved exported hypothetical protein [uncultured Stenotrophomonas sp.]|uniref:Lipoprotein n=1 Tax=uncultured Stenotrophomonas sp. TaxID=165438 RepID=A0A1Y5Q2F8_9GAMM|nr:conserved exported hypothetical protein [uncultured Stenotrophomonas sp.]
MLKHVCAAMVMLGLSACASSDRLMDADVRPADRADCLVGNDRLDAERASGARSLRDKRCNPDDSLNWTIGQPRKDAMEVDFKKKHD